MPKQACAVSVPSMPTWETLEEFVRARTQATMQAVLEEALAVTPGDLESTESWTTRCADLKARGLDAPRLMVADGAAGAWAAAGQVWTQMRE